MARERPRPRIRKGAPRMRLAKLLAATAAVTALAAGVQAAAFTDGKIKIGVLNDQTGLYADLGGQGPVLATRLEVEDSGGSLDAPPVEIVFADHQNKPDIGSNIARQWYDVDQVDLIVDVPNSA